MPATARFELPVKLRVHDSIFVPLAKWAMLLTGNYRCVTEDGADRHQGRRPPRHRDLARGLQLGVRRLREARRLAERSGAVREICRRGQRSRAAVFGRAGAQQRRAEHRAHRPAGAADRARNTACATRSSTGPSRSSMPGSRPTAKPPRNPRSRRFIAAAQHRKEKSDEKPRRYLLITIKRCSPPMRCARVEFRSPQAESRSCCTLSRSPSTVT